MMGAKFSSPSRSGGEGDHAKHGGGVCALPRYPSTILRMVPLPILWMGRKGA
jgi:hypothetical protein